ncbi:MAG: T9SS type A sorting domain-containing protein [Bacteroidetes bacterium]|nr:T9SS type A sorting domain-containing protein [Bacteroidota bacterium]
MIFYDSLGCYGNSVITLIIITNINEQDIVDAINIFPNPAFDNITLELPAKINEVLCTIYDLSGRKILSYRLTETRNQISVADFSAGGYMIGLIGEEFSGYKGLIIEK